MANKRVNSVYYFDPVFFDKLNGNSTQLFKRGQKVRVINLFGCPPANTMGMCYIIPADATKDDKGRWNADFAMVMTNSLEKDPPAPEPVDPVITPSGEKLLGELFDPAQPSAEEQHHEQTTMDNR